MPCKNRMTFVSSLQSMILLDCLKKYFNLYFVIIELVAGIKKFLNTNNVGYIYVLEDEHI